MKKIYFYDNGIRNSLTNRFEGFKEHPDRGALWESFGIGERIKSHGILSSEHQHFFWRLKSGAAIDLVEEVSGKISGFEFKANQRNISAPASWKELYPNSTWRIVSPDNFTDEGLAD